VSHNFDEFIPRVKDLNPPEIEWRANREADGVDEYLKLHCRGKGARSDLCGAAIEYRKLLGELVWLMCNGARPGSAHDWDLPRIRPAIESLVRRGFLGPATLTVVTVKGAAVK
jgi:hypothetical protein